MSVGGTVSRLGSAILAGVIGSVVIDAFNRVATDIASRTPYGWIFVLAFALVMLASEIDEIEVSLAYLALAAISFFIPLEQQIVIGGIVLMLGAFLIKFKI